MVKYIIKSRTYTKALSGVYRVASTYLHVYILLTAKISSVIDIFWVDVKKMLLKL